MAEPAEGRRSIAGSQLGYYPVVSEAVWMGEAVGTRYLPPREAAGLAFWVGDLRKIPRPQVRPQEKTSHPDGCVKITDFHWILIGRPYRTILELLCFSG
jgi:hypothetical protein